MKKQSEFKYIFYVEGHFGWANRLRWLLAMNNLIIYQTGSPCHEFYSLHLAPFVHYVPVSYDFRNLTETLEWILENEYQVAKIVSNARTYFRYYLSASAIGAYVLETFRFLYRGCPAKKNTDHVFSQIHWKPFSKIAWFESTRKFDSILYL